MVFVKGNWPECLSVMVSVKGNSFFRKFMPQLFLMKVVCGFTLYRHIVCSTITSLF